MNDKEYIFINKCICFAAKTLMEAAAVLQKDLERRNREEIDFEVMQEELRLIHYAAATLEKIYRMSMQMTSGISNQISTISHSDKSCGVSTEPEKESQA